MPTDKTYPIILAHGIARFDVLSNGLFKIDNDDNADYKDDATNFCADKHG